MKSNDFFNSIIIDALGLLLTAFVLITILSVLVASVTYLVFAP
jgi:hypothetical protein